MSLKMKIVSSRVLFCVSMFVHGFAQVYLDSVSSRAGIETNLLKVLFTDYDKRVLPLESESQSVPLSIGIKLLNIIELLEHEEVLQAYFYMQLMWSDFRLKWESSKYEQVHVLHLPVDELWQPDVSMINNVQVDFEKMNSLALLFPNGYVYHSPKVRTKSRCEMDMTRFPRDQQTCTIKFGSFSYDQLRLNLSHFSDFNTVDLSEYTVNKEWTLSDTSVSIITDKYECCPETYQYIQFNFKLKRNAVYYTHVFVLPAVLIALLVPFQFLLPPDSRERLSIGSILLLGCVVLIFMIQTYMPPAHPNVPYIVQYYSLTMIWITVSIIYSIWVIANQGRGQRNSKVPGAIRLLFLQTLKKVVCLNDEHYQTLEECEPVTFRSLEKQVANSQSEDDNTDGNKLEKDVEQILRNMNLLVLRSASRSEVHSEWYQVIIVLDRVMSLMFLLVFIVYTCMLFS